MGCCGVSVKEPENKPYKKIDPHPQGQQNAQNNPNNQSINIYKNPLQQSKDLKNQRYQPPVTNENNNLNSTEQISFYSSQRKSELKKEKVKSIKNIEILDNVKEYLPDDMKGKQKFNTTWGRLVWNGVSPTIDTRFDAPSNGTNSHPELNRAITPREAARIQSFSDDFIFYG